jgi:small subunit ribosomal protein S8
MKRVSRPGLRNFVKATELPRVINGLGTAIISTSKGLLTDKQARKENVGGEVMFYIY